LEYDGHARPQAKGFFDDSFRNPDFMLFFSSRQQLLAVAVGMPAGVGLR
jgi:hypothetical protein